MKDKIIKLIDEVKANSPNTEKFIVYGTEEHINQIKNYLPPNVSARILPTEYLPEDKGELVHMILVKELDLLKDEYLKRINEQNLKCSYK